MRQWSRAHLTDDVGGGMPILATAAITFYAATWETFYTHTLYLGYINGPVDGTLSICLAFLLTGYFGERMPQGAFYPMGGRCPHCMHALHECAACQAATCGSTRCPGWKS